MTNLATFQVHPERVTVVSGPNCVRCQQTLRLLDSSNVKYDVIDSSENPAVLDAMRATGLASLPAVIPPAASGLSAWGGFDMLRLRQLKA